MIQETMIRGCLWLVLLFVVQSGSDRAPVQVTYYPTVEASTAAGAARLHNRPPSRSLTALSDPYILPSAIADICVTYAVDSTSQFLGDGTVPDHSADNITSLTPGEIFCNTGVGVYPTSIQQALSRDPLRIRNTQDGQTPHFAFFACTNMPLDTWNTDPDCDTNERKTAPGGLVENCNDMGALARQLSVLCKSCAWDCSFGLQCFESLGLPALPFFDTGAAVQMPCADPEDCRFYCCFQQESTPDTVTVTSTCTGVSEHACGAAGKTSFCSAQSTWKVSDPRSTAQIQQYRCSFACDFPCATGTAVSLSECENSAGDRKTNCFPRVMDRQCTVNVLQDRLSVCPDGGTPVIYQNATLAAALGEDPYTFDPLVDREPPAPGQTRRCIQAGARGCADPVCKCLDPQDCPKHPSCSGHGTLRESLYPHVRSVCQCDAGYFGETCFAHVPDQPCGKGLPCATDGQLFELGVSL